MEYSKNLKTFEEFDNHMDIDPFNEEEWEDKRDIIVVDEFIIEAPGLFGVRDTIEEQAIKYNVEVEIIKISKLLNKFRITAKGRKQDIKSLEHMVLRLTLSYFD